MAARKNPRLDIQVSSLAEEQAAKFMRGLWPWLTWLGGIPLASATFRIAALATHHVDAVAACLAAGTVVVTIVTWRTTHARGWGRVHHAINTAAALGLITLVAWLGPAAWHWLLLVIYLTAGVAACLIWNLRYTSHSDGPEDVLSPKIRHGRKRVDWAYMIRVLAGRAPVIRTAAEKTGKVVPAVVSPWREPAKVITVTPSMAAITAGDHTDAADTAAAARMWESIRGNWRDLTAHKVPELNGARMRLLDAKPWRVRTEIVLVRGVQIPKSVTDARELMASQNGMPLSSIIVKPNPRDHRRVFADFVLEDVLATVRYWPGPSATGQSIADAPVRFGIYEDRVLAESWECAINAETAKRLGIPEQNLSHPVSEGMTGAGKSTYVRVVIADGAARTDVVDWAIDTVKKYQTLGCVAGALDWLAVTPAEARKMIRFLADQVIPERANYLGMHSYDNWEPGCGLPLLRVTIEEGGIIANELEKLDHVLNSARSAGVKIRASFQRAHHAMVDTNVRAAFGEALSFGVKSSEDVFVMDDEMREAGADPSFWQDRQPGMLFRSAASIPFERRLMPLRCFKADPQACTEIVAAHAPRRDERVAADCPDWAAMLARLDVNHAYERRTTGTAVREQMAAAAARRDARQGTTATPATPVVAEPLPPADVVPDFPPDHDEETPVSMDELDLDPELAAALAEDDGIDPRQPIAEPGPDEELDFGRPRVDELGRDDALRLMRGHLMNHGDGWEFAPKDIYDDICRATGRGAGWVRTELSTTLVAEGLVEHDRAEGRYRVRLETRRKAV